MRCSLCAAVADPAPVATANRRYSRCGHCDLISVHPENRPLPLDEVVRYLEHENDASDIAYRAFLQQMADPLCAAVPTGAHGIDIGCGPTPVLADMLTASGRSTAYYDPLFHANDSLLTTTYDFVTCTEVAEHAHDPAALFRQLMSLIRPGGVLAVMTQMHGDHVDFERWWYRRDLTHVCFYSASTMRWLADHFECALQQPSLNVVLFTKRTV